MNADSARKIIGAIEDALVAAYKKITAKGADYPRQIGLGNRQDRVLSS